MSIAVGIDLGTTNTVAAAVRDGLAFTIADPQSRRLIPSTVSFHPSGKVLVGYPALDRRLIDPENTVFSVKRLIGRSWTSDEVQAAKARFAFQMKEGPKQGTIVVARGEEYTLPEISAFVLRYAKATAEAALGVPVDRAVITVPANFNDLQRAATKVAGKLAGLDVLRILNEPTAAALAYGQGATMGGGGVAMNEAAAQGGARATNERVAVYDLGGGTFDITLLDLSGNVFEVLATAGDTALGGDDFDNIIAERMIDEMLKKTRYDARSNPQAWGQLRILAEQLKRDLSTKEDVSTEITEIGFGDQGRKLQWGFRMTRTELEWASLPLVDRTFQTCQAALERAGLSVEKVDRVILVGGSTRMPLVARRVEQFFKKPPVMRVNPDEVVALGAAIQAASLDRATRRRTATAAVAPPVKAQIADDSIVQQQPSAPRMPARPATTEDSAITNLPIVDGTAPAPPKPFAATQVARGKPIDPPTPIMPIAPVNVGDLESELPAPDSAPGPLPPPTSFGRPLVFDMDVPHATVEEAPPQPPALPPPPPNRTQVMQQVMRDVPPPPPSIDPVAPAAKPPLLIDVTPLSLNVETVGGFCDKLIEGNTPVPCDRTRIFLTASDNQTAVFVRVSQGESVKFVENTFLGELELSGLKAAPRGEVQIAVTFEIDADGILNVRAKDVKSGNETKARMHLLGAQTEEHEIAEMQARQARHAVG
jgi:molecular chaperone DnaK